MAHEAGKCRLKQFIPLGTKVEDFITGRGGQVIILNPSDAARDLVGVIWADNGHQAKVHRDQLEIV